MDIQNIVDLLGKYKDKLGGIIPDDMWGTLMNDVSEKLDAEKANTGHVNIVMAGGTGVGKSTLINAVFGKELAKTGVGKPVTNEITKISVEDMPVTIYDTMGFELGGDNRIDVLKEKIGDLVEDSRSSSNPEDWIHMVWYCISLGKPKIQDAEIDYINYLCSLGVPVILVITQAFSKKKATELKTEIETYGIDVKEILYVLAQDFTVDIDDEEKVIHAYNADVLVEISYQYLPEASQKAFIAHQKASVTLKQKAARKYLAGFATANFGAGFLPIPMADAPVLITTEVAMMTKISAIFGITIKKKEWLALASVVIGCSGATVLGKAAVSGLLKLIPGAGTAAGGAISGTTAAALTYALGEAYIQILSRVEKGEIEKDDIFSKETTSIMKELVQEGLKNMVQNNKKAE